MKKFCTLLREHTINVINFEKKKRFPLTKKEQNYTKMRDRMLHLWKRDRKGRDHCHYTGKYRGTTHSICNIKFNVPNEIPIVFPNGSNYVYNFIIKELAKEFEECLGENTEK